MTIWRLQNVFQSRRYSQTGRGFLLALWSITRSATTESVAPMAAKFWFRGPITDWWNTEFSYSYLDLDVATTVDEFVLSGDRSSSRHQLRLESNMDISDRFSIDTFVHHVSEAPDGQRGAYTDLDVRVTYRLNSQISFSAVGSNLLDDRRLEYFQDTLPLELVYVPRSAYIEARVRF